MRRLQVREDGSARPVDVRARPPSPGGEGALLTRFGAATDARATPRRWPHCVTMRAQVVHPSLSFPLPSPVGDGRLDRGHYRGPHRVPAQESAAGSFSRDNGGAQGLQLCGPFVSRAAALISGFGGHCQLVRTLADRIARPARLIPGITDLAL